VKINKIGDDKDVSKMTIKNQQEDLKVAIKEEPRVAKSDASQIAKVSGGASGNTLTLKGL
jgi:hypothetical protein